MIKARTPLAVMGVTAIILFAPFLLHPDWLIWPQSGLGSDIKHLFYPQMAAFAEAAEEGRLALWESQSALGHPISGDIGRLWLYPTNVLFLIFPTPLAFSIAGMIHLFLGGVFTYFLAQKTLDLTRPAALISGLAFMLMPKTMAHLAGGHLGNVYGLTWLPAVLLGTWMALQTGSGWASVLVGAALALQLPTHPQMVLLSLYAVTGLVAWSFWKNWKEIRIWLGKLIKFGFISAASSACLGAVWWLPTLELLPLYTRIQFMGGELTVPFWYQLPPGMLLTLFSPPNFQFPEWTMYVGVFPLLLALLALIKGLSSDARQVEEPAPENIKKTSPALTRQRIIFLWLTVCLALVVSLGNLTPLPGLLDIVLPGFAYFRTRTRLWFLGGLGIALLAGEGVRILEAPSSLRFKRKLKIAASIYFTAGLVGLAGMSWITQRFFTDMLFPFVSGCLAFIYFLRSTHVETRHAASLHQQIPLDEQKVTAPRQATLAVKAPPLPGAQHSGVNHKFIRSIVGRQGWRYAVLVGILLLDLVPLAGSFMTQITPAETFLISNPIVEYLKEQPKNFRVYSPRQGLEYGLLAQEGIESLDGLLNFQLDHVVKIAGVASGCEDSKYTGGIPACIIASASGSNTGDSDSLGSIPAQGKAGFPPDPLQPAILGLLNVRYIISPSEYSEPDLEWIMKAGELNLYENKLYLPRAFLADEVVRVEESDLFQVLKKVEVRKTVLIEKDHPFPSHSLMPVPGSPKEGVTNEAKIYTKIPGNFQIEVKTLNPAILVISEAWAPGWRATVNGESVEVYKVDGALIGIFINPGRSQVELVYRPWGWQVAWPITLVAWAVLGIGTIYWLLQRK